MRDDLIGFVLGALDTPETERIRQKVEQDHELRRQVELVERGLRPLSLARDELDPPLGLAQRTCARLWDPVDGDAGPPTRSGRHPDIATDSEPLMNEVAPARYRRWEGATNRELGSAERSWTFADFVVAAGVCVACACLFFPAIANSRWHSQLAGCQNNMRDLGTALIDYSGGPGGYFPQIPASGKLSVAGIYAPKLVEKGLVHDGRVFLCPAKGSTLVVKIPRVQDVMAAGGPQLVTFHRTMGGDYAYPLGFVDQGQLRGVRNQGRAQFALLADAPLENVRNVAIGTHGRGQNMLFEDGHVKFQTARLRPGSDSDDLFVNDRGFVRAGLHAEDAVLAPSPVSPLPDPEEQAAWRADAR